MTKQMTRRQFAFGSTAALGAMASTAQPAQNEAPAFEPMQVPRGDKRFGYRTIIDSSAVKLDMPVGVVNGTEDGPTLVVTGGLYATEYCGVEAASRLYRDTEAAGLKGRLVIVPVVNMSAFQFRTPMFKLSAGISPMDGKDLNGVFPGRRDGTITEILAWYLFNELVVQADAHVDLRGGDLAESHLVHSIHPVSGDERVNRVSEEMSRACGYEFYQPRMPREKCIVPWTTGVALWSEASKRSSVDPAARDEPFRTVVIELARSKRRTQRVRPRVRDRSAASSGAGANNRRYSCSATFQPRNAWKCRL